MYKVMPVGYICDVCGWVHGTPGENRAFRWCRKVKGTVCDQCCKECQYCKDWHCMYDIPSQDRMRQLGYANREDERIISKFESELRYLSKDESKDFINKIIKKIKDRITAREIEHDAIHSGEMHISEKK